MDISRKLRDLGFDNAEVLGSQDMQGRTLCRIMTSKGFTYERFTDESSVEVWARDHEPEVRD